MRIKITYEKDTSASSLTGYWAIAQFDGKSFNSCGGSWEDAKNRLLLKVSEHLAIKRGEIEIPADEEVEI